MTLHILALETSSSLCGVALLSETDRGATVRTRSHDATAEHAERLLPMIDDVLAQAGVGRRQLAAVAFGQGPGGFTGLRVACGVAQGMAFALDIPVVPVPSLLAVAQRGDARAPEGNGAWHVVVQDARMGEVYLAAYRRRHDQAGPAWATVQQPVLLDAGEVGGWLDDAVSRAGLEPGHPVRMVGDALHAYPSLAQSRVSRPWLTLGEPLRPDAETIARLAVQDWHLYGGIAPELAAPLYVREKVAYTTRERERGAGGNPRAADARLSIEPMAPAHLDDVVAIERSVQAFPWTRGNFADGLEAGYSAWVVRQRNQTVGFCMTLFAPDVAHVLVIAVKPAHQNQGAGTLLLNRCEREARARGLSALMLEVRPSNVNALTFYRNLGFRQIAMRRDYYPAAGGEREDACVMQKRLDAPGASS
jgi:tRNA threonylcarbamoyladenosine biosynthesis protein TsaB